MFLHFPGAGRAGLQYGDREFHTGHCRQACFILRRNNTPHPHPHHHHNPTNMTAVSRVQPKRKQRNTRRNRRSGELVAAPSFTYSTANTQPDTIYDDLFLDMHKIDMETKSDVCTSTRVPHEFRLLVSVMVILYGNIHLDILFSDTPVELVSFKV